jgi:hypothetical protein
MRVIVICLLLGGCVSTGRDGIVYTKAEVDAINARTECKLLARNLVQIARCDNR